MCVDGSYTAVNKDELLQMVRFGAEMVFSSKDSTITDEDIDRIIAKGEEATAELDAKMKKFTEDAIKFKMDDSTLLMLKMFTHFFLILDFNFLFSTCLHAAAELYDFDDEKVNLTVLVCLNVHFVCVFFSLGIGAYSAGFLTKG